MSTKVNIDQFLKTKIKPRAETLLKEHPKLKDQMLESIIQMEDEIGKKNERMIRHHVKALELLVAELANRLSQTEQMLDLMEELEPDKQMIKELEQIEKWTEVLSDLARRQTKNYGIGKTSVDKGKDALEAGDGKGDAAKAKSEWAVMEAWLRKQLELAKKRLEQMTATHESARKAVAARDQKALDKAMKASTALVDAKPALSDTQDAYAKFCTKCEKELTKDQQDQLARDRKTFDAIMNELISINGKLLSTDVVIGAMEIQSVDIKKAAALLKIPSSHESKLKKALESSGSAKVKALDALAKELKLDITGKDMIDTLQKARMPGV